MAELLSPTKKNGEPIKERLCFFGPTDAGKSHILFTIAAWHEQLGSDAVFYVISTDGSYEVLEMHEQFEHLSNIRYVEVTTFQEFLNAAKGFHAKLRPQDWLVLDLWDDAWAWVQDEYARLIAANEGKDFDDIGDMWLASGEPDKYPIEGWQWQTPNARYRKLANNVVNSGPGHRLVICRQAQLLDPTEKMKQKEDDRTRMTREMFRHVGFKPAGQKDDPFRWHSIFHIDRVVSGPNQGQRVLTAKERWQRKRLQQEVGGGMVRGVALEDFYFEYMVPAGWRV